MKIVQAHADYHSGMITYYERVGDRVRKRQTQGEFVCFLAKKDVKRDLLSALRSSRNVAGLTQEGDWLRVAWKSKAARDAACEPLAGWFRAQGLDTYEADLLPLRRWMADQGVEIDRPRRCYFDIETCARFPMSQKEKMRILTWTLMDDAGNAKSGVLEADTDEAEKTLLAEFWATVEAFDQVLAWNGDNFDPMFWNSPGYRGKYK